MHLLDGATCLGVKKWDRSPGLGVKKLGCKARDVQPEDELMDRTIWEGSRRDMVLRRGSYNEPMKEEGRPRRAQKGARTRNEGEVLFL